MVVVDHSIVRQDNPIVEHLIDLDDERIDLSLLVVESSIFESDELPVRTNLLENRIEKLLLSEEDLDGNGVEPLVTIKVGCLRLLKFCRVGTRGGCRFVDRNSIRPPF